MVDASHDPRKLTGAAPIRLMIVDDDLFVRSNLVELLPRLGNFAIVGVHSDGAEAVAAVDEAFPDVVLMDLSMASMSGVEATRRIHRSHPAVKILALTSLADPSLVARMRAAGATGFLFKDTPVLAIARALEATHLGLIVMSDGTMAATVEQAPALAQLNEMEMRILTLICQGLTNIQIAAAVSLAPSTVKHYVSTLMQRLRATNRTMLAVNAGPYLRARH